MGRVIEDQYMVHLKRMSVAVYKLNCHFKPDSSSMSNEQASSVAAPNNFSTQDTDTFKK